MRWYGLLLIPTFLSPSIREVILLQELQTIRNGEGIAIPKKYISDQSTNLYRNNQS